jgi:hypothetical protein
MQVRGSTLPFLDSAQGFAAIAGPRLAAPSSAVSAKSQDWSKLRKAKPADHLLPPSKKWLGTLPREIFPGPLRRTTRGLSIQSRANGTAPTIARHPSTNSPSIGVTGGKDFRPPRSAIWKSCATIGGRR